MFKLDLSDSYAFPVKIEVIGENGKQTSYSFTGKFKRFSQSEIDDIVAQSQAGELKDVELAEKVLVGWDKDFLGPDGTPFEYNDENMRLALDTYPVRPSVISAWFESLNGAKRKN